MTGSGWTDEELEFFTVILVAGSAAITVGEYCCTYLFRNPPRSVDYDHAQIIDRIIRARETNCVSQLRMKKTMFFNLCLILRDKGLLADAKPPVDMIGIGMVDIGGVMKSIAISIDKGKDFGRMSQIIPALEEFEGLTADEMGKFYVVFVGRQLGIYYSWEECKVQVDRYNPARFRSYKYANEAFLAWIAFISDDVPNQAGDGIDKAFGYYFAPDMPTPMIPATTCTGNHGKSIGCSDFDRDSMLVLFIVFGVALIVMVFQLMVPYR